MPVDSRLSRYTAEIDWGQLGDFSGDHDDVTAVVLLEGPHGQSPLTIAGQGRDQARGLAPPQESSCDLTLANDDRRFSLEYSGSPLAGQVRPGRPVRVRMTHGSDWYMDDPDVMMDDPSYFMDGDIETVGLFRGTTDAFRQTSELGQRALEVHSEGLISRWHQLVATTILYEDITVGEALVHLFEAGGLVDGTDFEVDQDFIDNGRVLDYWYADTAPLFEAAVLLIQTEGYSAFLGEDEDGLIVAQGRNYRSLQARSTEIQATFTDTPDALYHVGFRAIPELHDVFNAPYVDTEIRAFQSAGTVWTYGQTLTLDGSGAASVEARPSDPFKGAITPVVSTDFTLSGGTVGVSLSRTSGGVTTISFSGGDPSETITGLALRAEAYTIVDTVRSEPTVDTSASVAEFGEIARELEVYPGLAVIEAEGLCDSMTIAYQDIRPILEVDVANVDAAHLRQIALRRIADRIHVVDAWSGTDLDVTIEQKRHQITTGRNHLVTWGCEKVIEFDAARYDIDTYNNSVFGQ